LTGNQGASEQEVPNEQHVAKVALVMPHAVVVGDGVVGPVRGGG